MAQGRPAFGDVSAGAGRLLARIRARPDEICACALNRRACRSELPRDCRSARSQTNEPKRRGRANERSKTHPEVTSQYPRARSSAGQRQLRRLLLRQCGLPLDRNDARMLVLHDLRLANPSGARRQHSDSGRAGEQHIGLGHSLTGTSFAPKPRKSLRTAHRDKGIIPCRAPNLIKRVSTLRCGAGSFVVQPWHLVRRVRVSGPFDAARRWSLFAHFEMHRSEPHHLIPLKGTANCRSLRDSIVMTVCRWGR